MALKKLIFLAIISFTLISAKIGGYSVYILDEAKNAECAREMLTADNFIVPVFNGELRTDKPPLHYYFMMASYVLFGETPFAARFFSVIFGVLTVLLTYVFTQYFLSQRSANYAVMALLSSLAFMIQFHLATPDPYLIFFVTAALVAYFYFDQTRKKAYLYLSYISVGFGILTKGPVAMVLPGLSVFFYLLSRQKLRWSEIQKLMPLRGLLIVLLIAAPWYLLVHFETNGVWTRGFFLDHNLSRYAEAREGHGGSMLLPVVFLFSILLPFAVFFPQVVMKVWKEKEKDVVLFSAITLLVVLAFFSFSGTKLPNYVAPAFPFAAVLIGYFVSGVTMAGNKGLIFSLIALMGIGGGSWWSAFSMLDQKQELAGLQHLSFYFGILVLGAFAGLILLYFRQKHAAMISLSFGFIIFHQCFFYFIYPRIDAQNPVRSNFDLVNKAENIIYYKTINPAFIFSLKRTIPGTDELSDIADFLNDAEDLVVISHPKFEHELSGLQGLKVLVRQQDLFDTNHVLLLKADVSPSR